MRRLTRIYAVFRLVFEFSIRYSWIKQLSKFCRRKKFVFCFFATSPLVIYVYIKSVTKRKESSIPIDFVIVAKQIVLVTIQICWFRLENNVLLMQINNQFARNGC